MNWQTELSNSSDTTLSDNLLAIKVEQALRDSFISYLEWNDSNGIYSDQDSMVEFGRVMTTSELAEMVHEQLTEDE